MEDFYYAGGVRAVMNRMRDSLHLDAMTVNGAPIGAVIESAEIHNDDVIRPIDQPLMDEGGIAVLRGTLAPGGAIIKRSAASPGLLQHRGRARWCSVAATNCSPASTTRIWRSMRTPCSSSRMRGLSAARGCRSGGQLPIPRKLLLAGVTDDGPHLRCADERHLVRHRGAARDPEAAVGGPLGLVRTGDEIVLDVPGRRLDLLVEPEELERRRSEWTGPEQLYTRGYGRMFLDNVTQADLGCDFGFLIGARPESEDIARQYASKGHT